MKIRFRESIGCLALGMALATIPAAAQRGRPARPEVDLPEGPVRQVILRSCTACHGIDEYGYYAMDRAGWDGLIERMKTAKSGVVEGTVISEEDKEVLLDWLVATFGPDSTPFPREYVPRELSEADYLSDDQAEALLADACESCHTLERVDQTRASEEQWRATLISMIGRGAPLPTSDIEPLVEWLGRTHGTNPTN